jgi:hypothetical protein
VTAEPIARDSRCVEQLEGTTTGLGPVYTSEHSDPSTHGKWFLFDYSYVKLTLLMPLIWTWRRKDNCLWKTIKGVKGKSNVSKHSHDHSDSMDVHHSDSIDDSDNMDVHEHSMDYDEHSMGHDLIKESYNKHDHKPPT